MKNKFQKMLSGGLSLLLQKFFKPKAAVNTRAIQTLREMQSRWSLAKRLDCGGFSTAFQNARGNWDSLRFRKFALAATLALLSITISPLFAGEKPSCCSKELSASEAVSDNSLYQLESTWTTDSGAPLKLSSLAGRPQIVTMFFAKCTYACPILVNDMQRIEAALPENLRGKVGFVLVSFDSENDTVPALANYRKNHGLGKNWTLVRGNPDDILELGALLGVKFKKETSGQFAHSNVITLLDSKGEIVSQQMGLNRGPEPTVAAVQKLFQASTD